MNHIKEKIEEAKGTLIKIDELRKREDNELGMWKMSLDEVKKKVNAVDMVLFEPESI